MKYEGVGGIFNSNRINPQGPAVKPRQAAAVGTCWLVPLHKAGLEHGLCPALPCSRSALPSSAGFAACAFVGMFVKPAWVFGLSFSHGPALGTTSRPHDSSGASSPTSWFNSRCLGGGEIVRLSSKGRQRCRKPIYQGGKETFVG